MQKNDNSLEQLLADVENMKQQLALFSEHQASMIDNYSIMMQNQGKVVENHDIVIRNQQTIIKSLGIIIQNQSSIIHNQNLILNNQAYLKTLIHTQTEILSILSNRNKEEISKEVHEYFLKMQGEISKGLEPPIMN